MDSVGEGEGEKIWENGIIIKIKKKKSYHKCPYEGHLQMMKLIW